MFKRKRRENSTLKSADRFNPLSIFSAKNFIYHVFLKNLRTQRSTDEIITDWLSNLISDVWVMKFSCVILGLHNLWITPNLINSSVNKVDCESVSIFSWLMTSFSTVFKASSSRNLDWNKDFHFVQNSVWPKIWIWESQSLYLATLNSVFEAGESHMIT